MRQATCTNQAQGSQASSVSSGRRDHPSTTERRAVATLLPLLQESIRWHRDSDVPLGSDTVLNTCRARRFATEGTWSSKRDAGAWAAAEPIVRAAEPPPPVERIEAESQSRKAEAGKA